MEDDGAQTYLMIWRAVFLGIMLWAALVGLMFAAWTQVKAQPRPEEGFRFYGGWHEDPTQAVRPKAPKRPRTHGEAKQMGKGHPRPKEDNHGRRP